MSGPMASSFPLDPVEAKLNGAAPVELPSGT
jgi:hypothetical protein